MKGLPHSKVESNKYLFMFLGNVSNDSLIGLGGKMPKPFDDSLIGLGGKMPKPFETKAKGLVNPLKPIICANINISILIA